MRLAGQIKAGYYPTPEDELRKIIDAFELQGGVTVLDPCAGDGRTLTAFKEKGCEVYGIELEESKAKTVQEIAKIGINADALYEVGFGNRSFDILFLNPPYDFESIDKSDDEILSKSSDRRLETKFLKKYTRALRDYGILIYIIPDYSFLMDFTFIYKNYEEIAVYRFSDQIYKQVVFIGRKATRFITKDELQKKKERFESGIETAIPSNIVVKHEKRSNTFIYPLKADPTEMYKCITDELSNFFLDNVVYEEKSIRPIKNVREGHLALLIASGFVDGKLEQDDGSILHIKGSVKKEIITEANEDNEESITVIKKSVPTPVIKVLKNNKIITVS